MSYRIEYDCPGNLHSPKKHTNLMRCIAGFFLLFLLLTQLFWPAGAQKLRQVFFPWDEEVTAKAFSGLVISVQQGDELSNAVSVFCREIITHAEYPD